jgi:hypothetical protein
MGAVVVGKSCGRGIEVVLKFKIACARNSVRIPNLAPRLSIVLIRQVCRQDIKRNLNEQHLNVRILLEVFLLASIGDMLLI